MMRWLTRWRCARRGHPMFDLNMNVAYTAQRKTEAEDWHDVSGEALTRVSRCACGYARSIDTMPIFHQLVPYPHGGMVDDLFVDAEGLDFRLISERLLAQRSADGCTCEMVSPDMHASTCALVRSGIGAADGDRS